MPYKNIPPSMQNMMEACVKSMRAFGTVKPQKGKTEEESIHAICYTQIMKNKKSKKSKK